MMKSLLEFSSIRDAYRNGDLMPVALMETLLNRIDSYPDKAVFISRVPRENVLAAARALDPARIDELPLFGIPYVVKDNIDVAGMETTAACPDFAYVANEDAVVVARLRAAGAILLGKTNLDQFATGLNGTRSPYGAPRSVFSADHVSGGSSSGSAVAVGAGLAAFSLGTDTAGSGRVPAAFNNLVGLKPTIGRIATTGTLPACRSLDCVSVFANSTEDALSVLRVAQGPDDGDAWSRPLRDAGLPDTPVVGILRARDRDFAGDAESAALYDAAIAQAEALGWRLREFDYAPFREVAAALYGSAYVAERLAAVKNFYAKSPDALHPVIRTIIGGAAQYSAVDAFEAMYAVQAGRKRALAEAETFDFMLLPTAPTIFTIEEMLAQPIAANSKLGLYTNFVNFLDMAAIAVPAGFRPDGMPFGVTLIGPGFCDFALGGFADALHAALGAGAGKDRQMPRTHYAAPASGGVSLVVAGAHLSGMVLNHELTARKARLVGAVKTAPDYKLFALATTPPKPGLVRVPGFAGPGIDVEIWSLSAENFGRFAAALPVPMGIGKVTLADGSEHAGFMCEAHALEGATDITAFGGWRAYQASRK